MGLVGLKKNHSRGHTMGSFFGAKFKFYNVVECKDSLCQLILKKVSIIQYSIEAHKFLAAIHVEEARARHTVVLDC